MKRTAKFIFICAGLCLAVSLWAQSNKAKTISTSGKDSSNKFHKPPTYPVFLGKSDISGAELTVPKAQFDALMKQGLTAKDSSGQPMKFHGFVFTYGERQLYEDSVGNLIVLTDLLTEYCFGDTLSSNITRSLFERTKKGDTAYIDDIQLVDINGKSKIGRSMRIVLTK
jgi:hypothetical protein